MIRHALVFWITVVLAVLGVIDDIFFFKAGHLSKLLIPILVFVVILGLYKYSSSRYTKKPRVKVKPSARTMEKVAAAKRSQSGGKRKHYPFQVIEGSKGKNDDQQPKYH
ncbi:hypothetical protein GRF59_15640 [Paenibacillus sp. HJL G12]|uniref:Uncharacterized protein n=1 Tax=Paenibacillus dendrobii TaxID=2691084 RepID=A0A7X3IKE0_9BACL|nr:hypothetical protein [Paenibacillus dendrobii]MWV45056.1 hypothetical protein [Paenibacillus dendrobii]